MLTSHAGLWCHSTIHNRHKEARPDSHHRVPPSVSPISPIRIYFVLKYSSSDVGEYLRDEVRSGCILSWVNYTDNFLLGNTLLSSCASSLRTPHLWVRISIMSGHGRSSPCDSRSVIIMSRTRGYVALDVEHAKARDKATEFVWLKPVVLPRDETVVEIYCLISY